MFRLFLLLLFLIIILYQVLAQTNIFYGINSGLVCIVRLNLPHENALSIHNLTNCTLDFFKPGLFLERRGRWIRWTRFIIVRRVMRTQRGGDDAGICEDFYDNGGDFSCYRECRYSIFASESPFNFWLYPFYWLIDDFSGFWYLPWVSLSSYFIHGFATGDLVY